MMKAIVLFRFGIVDPSVGRRRESATRLNANRLQRCAGAALVATMLLVAPSASAESDFIPDHGGAIIGASGQPFTIYPFYLGARWGSINPPSPAVVAHQEYLTKLASFISGTLVPPGVNPFIYQYGVVAGASVGPAAGDITMPPQQIDNAAIKNIIAAAHSASGDGHLPDYGPNILIMFFPDGGFTPCTSCSDWSSASYHRDAGSGSYYSVLFGDDFRTDASQVSQAVSHEIFEAATDPIIGGTWEDTTLPSPPGPAEICDSDAAPVFWYDGIQIWQCYDDSLGGQQTTTGYDPPTAFDPASFIVPVTSPILL